MWVGRQASRGGVFFGMGSLTLRTRTSPSRAPRQAMIGARSSSDANYVAPEGPGNAAGQRLKVLRSECCRKRRCVFLGMLGRAPIQGSR